MKTELTQFLFLTVGDSHACLAAIFSSESDRRSLWRSKLLEEGRFDVATWMESFYMIFDGLTPLVRMICALKNQNLLKSLSDWFATLCLRMVPDRTS